MKEKFTIEFYINNPSFRQWVKNPSRELDEYWQNWVSENEGVETYVNEAKTLIHSVHFKSYSIKENDKKDLWNKIEKGANKPYNTYRFKRDLSYNIYHYLKIAAVFAVIVASLFFVLKMKSPEAEKIVLDDKTIIKSASYGEKLTVKLHDGTFVKLNAGSSISYLEKFDAEKRVIVLKGEAFFDVSKDTLRPFIVKAGEISIEALGTSFCVSNYSDDESIFVSLTSGNVLLRKNDEGSDTLLLNPGQMASYFLEDDTFVKLDNIDHQLVGWVDDVIVFKNADWQTIEKKLERWFGVEIINENPNVKWDYSGEFKGYSLDKILKSICYAKDLEFEIDKEEIRIF